jgi:uncharacterized protein (TIGR02466 family)
MTETGERNPIRLEVRSYFATPIAVAHLPDAGAQNEALRAIILAREGEAPSNDHSNLGGWQSDWDFQEWGGTAGQAILAAANGLADRLTCDRAGKPAKVAWKVNAWANVNRRDHGNEFHLHPGSFWSGVYYVDDGGIADNPDLGGEFEMQDPRGAAAVMYAPMLAPNVPGGLSTGVSELIRPEAGTMILFPAWMSHAVRPYHGDAIRISIAFNLSV